MGDLISASFSRFSIEIETYYTADGGHQDNVFNLSNSEKRNRMVDLIDVVKDQVKLMQESSSELRRRP